MHKKLEAELVSIAHSILQMKNRDDSLALHKKTQELHEKLSVLLFIDDYLATTPNAKETKDELTADVVNFYKKKEIQKIENEEIIKQEPIIVETKKEEKIFETQKEVAVAKNNKKTLTLEEELKDTVSVDITADLFQKSEPKTKAKASLNDRLNQQNIQVGLNDRIAFVKHLFNHSQADFNRVLSQLNTFNNEKEAHNFIKKMVKPDYNWSGKEEYEERFLDLVERKFL